MEKKEWLAKNFEERRNHLKAVAFRMLGSEGEAEDAVQETWTRLAQSDSEHIENLTGWLTTVVARVCLDMLRSRKSKREEPLQEELHDIADEDLETNFIVADSVGSALLIVLEQLSPAERIAFVLHDLFDLPFNEIAPIIGHSEENARQLASRARRRIRGAKNSPEDSMRQQEVVRAFLAASRDGNFEALIKLLHPDATLRADETAVKVAEINKAKGAPQFKKEIKGAHNVAGTMNGKAAEAQLALINGVPGATWSPGGKPVVAFFFSVKDGKIADIEIVMDPKKLKDIQIEVIDSKNGR